MNTEINETIIPTPFMGVGFSDNGPSDPRISKALEKTYELLDIMEFVKVTKFELNEVMFDYFWQILVGNTPVHLARRVLEWFGYEGEHSEQKRKFVSMLKRNDISFTELASDNKEIELYPTIKEELALLPSNVKNSKFLVMEPRNLKKAIMKLNTKKGNAIREYYVDIEDLMKLYVEYTIYYNHRESQRKITSLEVMMADMRLKEAKADKQREEDVARMERQEQYMRSLGISLEEVKDQNEILIDETLGLKKQNKTIQRKLGIAVEDRAPLPDDAKKQERFILIKRHDPDYMAYYIIRAQYGYPTPFGVGRPNGFAVGYTQTKMKAERANFPNHEVLLDFRCNPNSKTLYAHIKENLKAKGVVFKGNNIDLDESDVNEEELIGEMTLINERKYPWASGPRALNPATRDWLETSFKIVRGSRMYFKSRIFVLLNERMFLFSDPFQIDVCRNCRNCGMMASTSNKCHVCKSFDVKKCNIPYSFKNLLQELNAMGIKTKLEIA